MIQSVSRPVRLIFAAVLVAILALALGVLVGCGGGGGGQSTSASASASSSGSNDLKDLREISWEGDELTVKVGTNKSTGCEWSSKFSDDSIIGYSVNRKFTLSGAGASNGQAVGTSAIGYKGKSAGTATITMTTPKDWDGNEPGYTYTVTVEVNADGTIKSATGK